MRLIVQHCSTRYQYFLLIQLSILVKQYWNMLPQNIVKDSHHFLSLLSVKEMTVLDKNFYFLYLDAGEGIEQST